MGDGPAWKICLNNLKGLGKNGFAQSYWFSLFKQTNLHGEYLTVTQIKK